MATQRARLRQVWGRSNGPVAPEWARTFTEAKAGFKTREFLLTLAVRTVR